MNITISPQRIRLVLAGRNLYWIFCMAFCGLYFLRDILGIGISYYIIYAAAAFTIMFVSKAEAIAFIVSISAFTGAGFTGVFSFLLLLCVAIKFWGHYRYVKLYSLLLLAMCGFELIHYYRIPFSGIGSLIAYVSVLMVLIIIQQYPSSKLDMELIINSFVCFSLFYIMMTVVQLWSVYGSWELFLLNGFRGVEYAEFRAADGLSGNPNYYTALCSLNLGLCALMLSKKAPKKFCLAAMGIFTVTGLLTVSKMFIVVIAGFVVYIAVTVMRKNFLKGLGITAILGIAVFVGFLIFGDTLIAMVILRFQKGELTTGRIKIVGMMLEYMKANPTTFIWGVGIQNPYYYIGHGIHSSLFEVIGGWGITGLIISVAYLTALIRDSRKSALSVLPGELTWFNYLPIIILLGYSLIGMLFSSQYGLIKMMVAIYAIQYKGKQKV